MKHRFFTQELPKIKPTFFRNMLIGAVVSTPFFVTKPPQPDTSTGCDSINSIEIATIMSFP